MSPDRSKRLSKSGFLFPELRAIAEKYRYAWAERVKVAGYTERFAQEALGHNSKAVHRAYAKRAQVKLRSLEEFESFVFDIYLRFEDYLES